MHTRLAISQKTKRRQPSPAPHAKHQPPSNTLNRGSPPRPTRKTPTTRQQAKKRQPSPAPHAKHQPPHNTLNRDSPPRPSSLDTGRTRNHRAPTATTARPQRTPNTNTRGGAYILCRDIRVSELCEDGSPAGAKRIICTSSRESALFRERKKSRRFRRISGIFFQVRPLGLEPRTH